MSKNKETNKKSNNKKGLSIILAIVVCLLLLVVGLKVAGYKTYAVITGSMEPKLPVGTMVVVKHADFNQIEKGDIITFAIDENITTVTHRVDGIDTNDQEFYTKGDNNESRDANPVMYGNVIGKVVFYIPYLGYVLTFLSAIYGKVVLGGIFIIFVVAICLWDTDGKKADKKGK